MKNNTTTLTTNNGANKERAKKPSFTAFFKRHSKQLACIAVYAVVLCVMASGIVSAEGATETTTSTAESLWSTVAGLIKTWVTRLGGVVMFVGGVMFGLGWKNNDAEQKSNGISTMISGAIVTAIAAMTSTFFA